MSNQIHELTLLRFLSEYTTKKREIDVKEIKLALEIYEMSVQEYAKESSDEQAQPGIRVPDYMDDFCDTDPVDHISNEDMPEDTSEEDTSEETNTSDKDRSKRWDKQLVDDIVNFSSELIQSRWHISQDDLAKLVLHHFGHRMTDNEKVGIGNSRAAFIDKVHKNIYNRLILTGSVAFQNKEYHHVQVKYLSN